MRLYFLEISIIGQQIVELDILRHANGGRAVLELQLLQALVDLLYLRNGQSILGELLIDVV